MSSTPPASGSANRIGVITRHLQERRCCSLSEAWASIRRFAQHRGTIGSALDVENIRDQHQPILTSTRHRCTVGLHESRPPSSGNGAVATTDLSHGYLVVMVFVEQSWIVSMIAIVHGIPPRREDRHGSSPSGAHHHGTGRNGLFRRNRLDRRGRSAAATTPSPTNEPPPESLVDDADAESGDESVETFLAERLEDVWIADDIGGAIVAIMEPDGSIIDAARTRRRRRNFARARRPVPGCSSGVLRLVQLELRAMR